MKKNIFLSLEFDNMNPIQKIEMLSSDLNTQILDEIIIIDYSTLVDHSFRLG